VKCCTFLIEKTRVLNNCRARGKRASQGASQVCELPKNKVGEEELMDSSR
jgi:hypothetical protein